MPNFMRRALPLALASAVLFAPTFSLSDDSDLFSTTSVAPNVLLLMDNSATMNTIIFHQAYALGAPVSCNSLVFGSWPAAAAGAFDPNTIYVTVGNKFWTLDGNGNRIPNNNAGLSSTRTHCGKTRTIFSDQNAGTDPVTGTKMTRWPGHYLNWYFSTAADPYIAALTANNNGIPSSCIGGAGFAQYQRTRMNVAKQVLKNVVCAVNLVGQVRFGIATYRDRGAGAQDANGGYVIEEIQIPSSNQQADLISAFNSLSADTDAPMSEALFQSYTYFMSRNAADLPLGVNGTTQFPEYTYNTSSSGTGGGYDTGNNQAADPVQYSCQKNFVMIVTDGDPTKDDFDVENPANTANGFAQFQQLIGDYNADGEVESQPNLFCSGCETTLYVDDIAKYMHDNDFRPDFAGDQTLDVYTIGFNASAFSNAHLKKTAQVGNGLFFGVSDEAALAQAIIDSLQDIIEKSQSFTAATVPASRTAAGEQIYVSLFTPTSKSPYWNGTLRSYRFTVTGEILSSNGSCALDDPTAPCNSGGFLPTATYPPYWDAADEMPSPGARNLFVSKLNLLSLPTVANFEHTSTGGSLLALDFGVTYPPATPYNGSIATNAEQLTAEIVANVRGCYFGTGANGVACQVRPSVLSDIFHSNPVVVGQPGYSTGEVSALAFRATNALRDRVIYAGSNGGFLHGFHAGDWQPVASPPSYDAGTGVELFGFMPWPARQNLRHLPKDTGGRDYYFVDGSPLVADAWLYTLAGQTVKLPAGSEWRTVLTGGMRQGGETYYALDITNPAAATCPLGEIGSGYPCLLWEFPKENAAAGLKSTIGETWGEAIVTRIKLSVGGSVVDRWVAIMTGGYHPSGDPNDHASYAAAGTKGRSIWIVDLKTGNPIAKRNFNVAGNCTLALAAQATDETGMCFAIPATPAVFDADDDGYSDTIVVGDLGGNVWKWSIKNVGWHPGYDGKTILDNNAVWPFRKLFRAPAYGTGPYYYKSFFFPPQGFLKNNVPWFAVGSGERDKLLYMSDPATTADNNRFYVFKDVDIYDAVLPLQPVILETNLLNLSSSSICADVSAYKGYFIVGNEGEKWVTNVEILNDYLFVGSYIPVPSIDPCAIGGAAYLYRFKASCGEPMIDGTPVSAVDPRAIDLGTGFPTDPRITVGPGGDADVIVTKQGGQIITNSAGKLDDGTSYWREVNN